MTTQARKDAWNDGLAYEAFIGRWSRLVGSAFVEWLALPAGGSWLDFGCGTGALTQTILAAASPRLVVGCDPSAGYVAFAGRETADARARFERCELPQLPETAGGFDAAVAGLVLNFVPSAVEAAGALRSRTRAGGVVAAYVWDYGEGMQMLRTFWDAAATLDPAAASLDEGPRFPICRRGGLASALREAGLAGVEERGIEVETTFRDFEDLWTPLLGGQGPAPGYVAGLQEPGRAALRDELRRRLPVAPNGRIALRARAWAARGFRA